MTSDKEAHEEENTKLMNENLTLKQKLGKLFSSDIIDSAGERLKRKEREVEQLINEVRLNI